MQIRRSKQQLISLQQRALEFTKVSPYRYDNDPIPSSLFIIPEMANVQVITKISDLMIDKVHVGQVFSGKIIYYPVRGEGIYTLIQDEDGQVIRVAIYNFPFNPLLDINEIFSIDRDIIIMDPFYKIAVDGIDLIRVDDPLKLSFPNKDFHLQCQKVNINLRDQGNKMFKLGDFEMAIKFYEQALEELQDQDLQKAILFSNMAQAQINLEYYRAAVESCKKSLSIDKSNKKAKYRLIESLIWTHRFQEAKEALNAPPNIDKNDEAYLNNLLKRITGNSQGSYDWRELFKNYDQKVLKIGIKSSLSRKGQHLNPEMKLEYSKSYEGLGVFAQKDISQGTLLLACNALEYLSDADLAKVTTDNHTELRNRILRKCQGDKDYKTSLLLLYNNENVRMNYSERREFAEKYNNIDSQIVDDIIKYNSFGKMDFDSYFTGKQQDYEVRGVWVWSSFFNHSCDSNSTYFHFRNMMFIRARRNIKKGEELTISYIEPCLLYEERKQILRKWKFDCACSLCIEEKPLQMKTNDILIHTMFSELEDDAGDKSKKQELIDSLSSILTDRQSVYFQMRLSHSIAQCGNWAQYTEAIHKYAQNIEKHSIDLGTMIWLADGMQSLKLAKKSQYVPDIEKATEFVFSVLFSEKKRDWEFFKEWFAIKYQVTAQKSIKVE